MFFQRLTMLARASGLINKAAVAMANSCKSSSWAVHNHYNNNKKTSQKKLRKQLYLVIRNVKKWIVAISSIFIVLTLDSFSNRMRSISSSILFCSSFASNLRRIASYFYSFIDIILSATASISKKISSIFLLPSTSCHAICFNISTY